MRSIISLMSPHVTVKLLFHPLFVPLSLLLHVVLRGVLIVAVPVVPTSDAAWYYERALAISEGQGFVQGGHATAFWPVGYPAFLAAVFLAAGNASPRIAAVAQVLLSVAGSLLVLSLARRLFRSEGSGRIAVLALAVYPNYVAYTNLTLSEVLVSFLLLLSAWFLSAAPRLPSSVGSGIAAGAAALVKSQYLAIPLLCAALTSRPGRRATYRIGAVILAAALIVAPWTWRNWFVFGELVPVSTNSGINLLIGNNPSARGSYMRDNPLMQSIGPWAPERQVSIDRLARQTALSWIREHPGEFLRLLPLKVWWLWAPDGEGEWLYQRGYAEYEQHYLAFRAVRICNQALYVLFLAGYVLSLPLFYRRFRLGHLSPVALFGHILVAWTTLVSLLFFGFPRFHFPVMPWIILYGAWWVTARHIETPSKA